MGYVCMYVWMDAMLGGFVQVYFFVYVQYVLD